MTDEPQFGTILVVDDNPATLYATSRVLRNAGFGVLEATSGGEALALVERGADLVVLDVNLPDINGFEVCRELRTRRDTARLPVIHLSATFVTDSHKIRGLEAGADGYLTHPVEPPVLLATINAFLRTRRAEEAMWRSEAKFRAIFENALNGISLLSDDMIYLEVNPAMCAILGRGRDEIIGKHISAFCQAGAERQVLEATSEVESNYAWRGAFPLLRADGQLVELDWNLSIHSLPSVRLAVVDDVTQRKLIEAERERLLASERAARTEAERANRLKDEFLSTLSHELRTPLQAIIGWSQILLMGNADPQQIAQGLESIERNAKAQAKLIEDLLDVARIDSNKLRIDIQSVDLGVVVNAVLEGAMPFADAKRVRVQRSLDPCAAPVTGDPARLQQVIWNLVNNAIKFTPSGGNVRVDLRRVEGQMLIVVTDDGIGISAEFLPHLFERFRQEDASSKRSHGGLGIGLTIVKHLVLLHGGAVEVRSAGEGLGAEFIVSLPVATATAALAHDEPAVHPPVTGREPINLEHVRVLIVDDERDGRVLLQKVVERARGDVLAVGSVPQALEMLGTFRPHVLVSDIGMPERDGYDFIREVRARGFDAGQMPAIALTAFARTEDRERALLAGFQIHAGKPIDAEQLVAAIAALAGRA